jgi:hypothetical protein
VTTAGRAAPTPTPPDPDDPRARTLGIVLIAVAVLIGVVLLAKGFSQEDSLVATAPPEDNRTTTTSGEGGGAVGETTTTTAATNAPANVTVLVANGSGTTGLAGTNADKLKTAGYTNVDTANAPTTTNSIVYFAPGAQGDAQAVATALGLDASSVAALPATPPVDPAGATVLVVVGSDRA